MRIYLIGFMGCGKSSLGKRLAEKLDYSFLDTDKVIEEQTGMQVADIFATMGEDAFRELEKKALRETTGTDDAVIATGGGLPCHFDNMDFMLKHGTTVYLRMEAASLAVRIENSHKVRPLVQKLKGDALIAFIQEKLTQREPYYMQANCILKGDSLKPKHVISLLFGNNGKNNA